MSGFPNRPTRTTYGPTRENEREVQNPKRELGAETVNLDLWQGAGMGLVIQRVAIGVAAAGSPTAHTYQGLAWDPLQTLPDIPVTLGATGVYTAVFQSQYADQDGTLVSTSLKGGIAVPQGTANLSGIVEITDAQTAIARIYTADSAVLTDSPFFLFLW